ncbi:MAG: methylenetetrahydrofolate--tRNA-(uracil(54)-C(5))-methyltransferase (FADH(2)-oxidizing) TrmFO [Sandaracinaceae bacterium]|nr:methylenetetrahydrofolate--tRNA-(uracil(54)-C(5))-methyltransferase (FADH(2)-oxidizing) TrmFO [Sandaracinaceae bacterium]
MEAKVTVVGAGLAGCECAWQLAERGVSVDLVEQKPLARTPAQKADGLAELVCSNSFRGADLVNAVGLLKEEMRRAGSLVMSAAEIARVPAGGALAVDRDAFSEEVTKRVHAHPRIAVRAEVVEAIPDVRPLVLATGPLTGDALAADLARVVGRDHLAYYDAIAPVVSADSINWDVVFRASRYDKGGDAAYGNCPMTKEQYEAFVAAVVAAEKVVPHEFEEVRYFEGCLPVEVMAERGLQTLAFGPMKPVGLMDPRTGMRPHAVVQLRQEDKHASAYNLVGFQTRMKWPDQQRVFRTIPGLEEAEFERLGSVHRNTYVDSPRALDDDLALVNLPGVYLAGQISGVEGYVESAAIGLVLGTMLAARARGEAPVLPPETTALGGLVRHLRDDAKDFAPSNVVWSMVPPLPGRKVRKRRERRERLAARALEDLGPWLEAVGVARPEAPHAVGA